MRLDSARGLKAEFNARLQKAIEVPSFDVAAYRVGRGGTRAFDVRAQPMSR